jgi:hypothetical protein
VSQKSDTVVTTPAPESADNAPSAEAASTPSEPRWQRVLTVLVGLAIVGYAAIGIGSPLLGGKVFGATDMLASRAPYVNSGLGDVVPTNTYLNDTVDSVLPNTSLFGRLLRSGEIALWNPYQAGGSAFGATPNNAVYNPLSVPYLVLPGWLAPGYVKLLEILVAAGATFLFLRRFRLGRAAALLGGLIYVGSAFMIAWTNWPQTRVAAFIPAVFWCVERLVTQRRARDAALLCLAVASMLFGGFPAVTGYAILFAGLYLVVRLLAEYGPRSPSGEPAAWRRIVGVIVAAGAALGGAVALAAIQLLPFVSATSGAYLRGRAQLPSDHLAPVTLLTSIAPWAFGTTNPNRGPYWYLPINLVESTAYLGAAAVLLVLVAVAWPRASWARLPRGGWSFFVLATGAGLVVLYGGGPPLAVLQKFPVLFSANYVGRMRSVLWFLLAVLAAVGFDLLVRRVSASVREADFYANRRTAVAEVNSGSAGNTGEPSTAGAQPSPPTGGRARLPGWTWVAWPVAVWAGAALLGLALLWVGRHAAKTATGGQGSGSRVSWFDHQVAYSAAFVLVAIVAVGVLWWAARREEPTEPTEPTVSSRGRRALVASAALLVPVLVVVQALSFAAPYWPKSDKSTFYPRTPVVNWLGSHLGDDRYAAGSAMFVGADSYYQLRSLNGHAFLGDTFGEALDGMPGWALGDPPTYVNFKSSLQMAQQPLFDRLGIRYFVTSPSDPVFGKVTTPNDDGSSSVIGGDQSSTFEVPGSGPLRAVSLTTTTPFRPSVDAHIRVSLRNAAGAEVAKGEREILAVKNGHTGLGKDQRVTIPVAAEQVPPGTRLTAVLTVDSATPLGVHGDRTSTLGTVRPASDGLKLVYADDAVVYQRLTALPRIRWASQPIVEPDAAKRVALVNSRALTADQVVLDKADPAVPDKAVAGGGAKVSVIDDGIDAITTKVEATGSGYLVVADALQTNWVATVDGKPADLVPADHGLVAVAVPGGTHTVKVAYQTPYHAAGTYLSALAGLVLVAIFVGGWWRTRRRRSVSNQTVDVER